MPCAELLGWGIKKLATVTVFTDGTKQVTDAAGTVFSGQQAVDMAKAAMASEAEMRGANAGAAQTAKLDAEAAGIGGVEAEKKAAANNQEIVKTAQAALGTISSTIRNYDDAIAALDAGAIYRVEYTAMNPRVMGLGFAATRDLIAFLRHAPAAAGNPLADIAAAPCERDVTDVCANPGGGAFSSAVAFGGSQSGRYLRDFLWQGFNRDPAGRRVFDGVIPFIPGARQTFTNFRFAEPGRFSRQHEDHDVPGFTFPFTYATLRDPVTGKRDGIFKNCDDTGTCPKLFHIDTSAEFWQAGSALVGTGGTQRDVEFPSEVRAYMIAGGAHAPGMTLPACRY